MVGTNEATGILLFLYVRGQYAALLRLLMPIGLTIATVEAEQRALWCAAGRLQRRHEQSAQTADIEPRTREGRLIPSERAHGRYQAWGGGDGTPSLPRLPSYLFYCTCLIKINRFIIVVGARGLSPRRPSPAPAVVPMGHPEQSTTGS